MPIIDSDVDDNPELTAAELAQMRPAREVLGDAFVQAQNRGGRPRKADPKQTVTLRLDPDIVRHLKATGSGWQTRINDLLAKMIARGSI